MRVNPSVGRIDNRQICQRSLVANPLHKRIQFKPFRSGKSGGYGSLSGSRLVVEL